MNLLVIVTISSLLAAGPADDKRVIVYTALDQQFSKPILDKFEKQTGLEVLAVYDTESTKTVGLANRIRAEKHKPRCDVFWNNEILNTIRLKQEGLLQPCNPANAAHYAERYKDPEGYWYGFAARARVLIANMTILNEDELPDSMEDLTDPIWRGQVGIAKPLFGTTATHVACLFEVLGNERAQAWLKNLKDNNIRIMGGNRDCARAVAKGMLQLALTDTDDAMIELRAGKAVRIVYLDTGLNDIGTLFLPNTLAMVRGCPNPVGAEQLINYLLSPEVEAELAAGPSAQIPLNDQFQGEVQVKTPQDIKAMDVDYSKAAERFQQAAQYIEHTFLP